MVKIYSVSPHDLIEKMTQEFKSQKMVSPPEWASFVKTGTHKERPPMRDDWWYVRTASVLRTVALNGPIGVSKLRTKYGGRKRRGHAPDTFRRGSGSIIRTILQQLETAGMVKKVEKDLKKGRILDSKGQAFIDGCAKQLSGSGQAQKKEQAE